MGATKKAKITLTCDPKLKEKLQMLADSKKRTLSNLCEMYLEEAVAQEESSDLNQNVKFTVNENKCPRFNPVTKPRQIKL